MNGVDLFYEETGRGPETIVFSHGLMMDHSMFAAQRAAFAGRFRVITYDHRGQGQSQAVARQDMDTLATDAAALLQSLNAWPCHFAGLSMGGFVGLRLAARRPALLRTLTLMNTGADREPAWSRLRFGLMARVVRVIGPTPFAGIAMKELFGESTRHHPAKAQMLAEWKAKISTRPRAIAEAVLGVMQRKEVPAQELRSIQCRTLILAGEEDTARPPSDSERLASLIPGSRLVRIPKCGHSSALEAPEAVIAAMTELLGGTAEASQKQAASN